MIRPWLALLAFASFWGFSPLTELRSFAEPVQLPHVEIELISEGDSLKPGLKSWIGLRQKIEPHWHTYWLNPGDTGNQPKLEWTQLPRGITAGPFLWPVPQRIAVEHLMNFGYEGEVLLPIEVNPSPTLTKGEQVHLEAKVRLLICEKVCIPVKSKVRLKLPVYERQPNPTQWKSLFEKTRQQLPQPLQSVRAEERGDSIEIELPSDLHPDTIAFFPTERTTIDHAAEQFHQMVDEHTVHRVLKHPRFKRSQMLSGVLKADDQAFEINTPLQRTSSPPRVSRHKTLSFQVALFFAFIGGLLLNLMPCVFPVLTIKVLSIVQKAKKSSLEVRAHGTAYLLGVLASFNLLSTLLIALKYSGEKLGWGFQLQSPTFNFILILILSTLTLSLAGFFELGGSLMNVGSGLSTHKGLRGSFFTGVLATIVATPCTAPFMGPAIGYALTQPPWVSLLIFNALALGMALPYTAITYVPALFRLLPRPGAWMDTFKKLMSIPMALTTVWLIWVLSLQTGWLGVGICMGACLVGGIVALSPQTQSARKTQSFLLGLVLIATIGAGHFGLSYASRKYSASEDIHLGGNLDALPWSPEKVKELTSKGRTVFVNFTAAWCITCKVNERLIFSSSKLAEEFKTHGVQYLVADWTNENPLITQALQDFGREGVPLYVVYKAGIERTEILPQVLTVERVLQSIR